MINVTTSNFEEEVLKSKEIVLVDFNANWCGPCQMLKPILEELSLHYNNCKFVSVNVDNESLLAEEYNIFSIPCVVIFKDGKEIKRSIGLKSKEEIEKLIAD